MFTKEEKKDLTKRFWVSMAERLDLKGKTKGRNIDWLDYPNKINHIYFRMESNTEFVKFCIDIQFLDKGLRDLYFEQFEELKDKLTSIMPTELVWLKSFDHPNTRNIARISTVLDGVNIYNEKDWTNSQQFLEDAFIAFDQFWCEFSDVFKALGQ